VSAATRITIVPEGTLDDDVIRRLLAWAGCEADIRSLRERTVPGRDTRASGRDTIRLNIDRYHSASAHVPFLILVDLDMSYDCPPSLLDDWAVRQNPAAMFLFRVAVRAVESWLLADARGLGAYLSVSPGHFPPRPDELDDPKRELVGLARKSRSSTVRRAISPQPGSASAVGHGYGDYMTEFVLYRLAMNLMA
jgi:hypothetical protein